MTEGRMTISRRVFVKSGGLALFSLGLDPLFLARAAYATFRRSVVPSDRPILVCLFQRGAVDGLNMIVPHGDPFYYSERPRIAVPASDVVEFDAQPLRWPGLHGIRHAGGEGDSGRMAQPLLPARSRAPGHALPRGRIRSPTPAHPRRLGSGARDRRSAGVRPAGTATSRPGPAHARLRGAVRGLGHGAAVIVVPGSVRSDANATAGRPDAVPTG